MESNMTHRFGVAGVYATLALMLSTGISAPIHADFDPNEAARERASVQRDAERRANALAVQAKFSQETLAKPPFNEDPKMLVALSDVDARALYAKRDKTLKEDLKAQAQRAGKKREEQMRAALAGLTPEQRAMIEKMSGKSIEELSKPAR
jgi:hypothetical protein